ncbi:tRNA pseudouridine synthase B [Planoprotostelium fungivorum]|uniref:tRNA pseudouridine(55) synthase n=1 Tax=Planoprotostelium fungivorum TaxID=1890364 RepID=A0A2P6N483_9EUKA|nr:tRNA pseudouridine synthase B [Planoprotostelium fungivorum]
MMEEHPTETEEGLILVNKPIGVTPFQLIQQYLQKHPECKERKISFAGRLDPMAHGLMILLAGDHVLRQKELELKTKEYHFQVLLGFSTDTYDVLGLLDGQRQRPSHDEMKKYIRENLLSYVGRYDQPYPPYSAARVDGRALHEWAKEGKLSEIQIPSVSVEVFELELLEETIITTDQLWTQVKDKIDRLGPERSTPQKKKRKRGLGASANDFRQTQILQLWSEELERVDVKEHLVLHFKARVSPGTFIRSIANRMGKELACGALAFDIYRTKVGDLSISDAEEMETRETNRSERIDGGPLESREGTEEAIEEQARDKRTKMIWFFWLVSAHLDH